MRIQLDSKDISAGEWKLTAKGSSIFDFSTSSKTSFFLSIREDRMRAVYESNLSVQKKVKEAREEYL